MDACDIFMNFNIGQYLSIYFLIPKAKSCQLPDRLEQCSNPPRKKVLWQNSSGGNYFWWWAWLYRVGLLYFYFTGKSIMLGQKSERKQFFCQIKHGRKISFPLTETFSCYISGNSAYWKVCDNQWVAVLWRWVDLGFSASGSSGGPGVQWVVCRPLWSPSRYSASHPQTCVVLKYAGKFVMLPR